MEIWKTFWTVALLVSASSFAGITLLVVVKGGRDMKNLLRSLRTQRDER